MTTISYKGKKYRSYKALYDDQTGKNKVPYSTYVERVKRGRTIERSLYDKKKMRGLGRRKITYKGVEYKSIMNLYQSLRHKLRSVNHHGISVRYETFLGTLNKYGIDVAVERACSRVYKRKLKLNIKKSSRNLGGADNLVCQRMTKLGWSYEKAISTPVRSVKDGKHVKYKGKNYRSMRECHNAVKSKYSYKTFCRHLKLNGCVI